MEFVLDIIKSIFLLVQRRSEERRAQRAELKKKFKESSDNLCSCIASGSESIKAIQDYLAKREATVPDSPDYAIIKDCTTTVSTFNKAQTTFFGVLDDLYLFYRNPQGYERLKYSLVQLLEEYAHDIQDTTYVTKLSQGVDSTFEDSNSVLLKNIISLFDHPQDNLGEIVLLRFKNDEPRDYYTDVQKICNNFAEMVKLPYKNDYQIIASPFKAGLGNSEQMYRLGVLFLQQGKRKQAVRWLEKATEKGNLEAHLALGRQLLKEGKIEAGLLLLRNASNQGHEDAILELGHYYADHKEIKKAIECFSSISDHRRDAKFYLANVYEADQDTQTSIRLFAELVGIEGAELDRFSAASMCHIIETIWSHRFFYTLDYVRVLDFYDKVDDSLSVEEMSRLPYEKDLIVLQRASLFESAGKYDQATAIYHELAKKNSPIAQCEIGCLYDMGYGIPKNKVIAGNYFRLSMSQHYPKAYAEFGRYLLGREEASDLKIGFNYLITATEYNIYSAFYYLILFYRNGFAARIGKGEKIDGVKYEEHYHSNNITQYLYVSLLDQTVKESSLDNRFFDFGAYLNNNQLNWWALKVNTPDFDQMTKEAEETQSVVFYGQFRAIPLSNGNNPNGFQLNDNNYSPGEWLFTIVRGKVCFIIYDRKTNDLIRTITISSSDKITSLYVHSEFNRCEFMSLEFGTVYRLLQLSYIGDRRIRR